MSVHSAGLQPAGCVGVPTWGFAPGFYMAGFQPAAFLGSRIGGLGLRIPWLAFSGALPPGS
jgi:hypothetical protein